MNFNEYQKESKKTVKYRADKKFEYLILGVCGEAGELAEKAKKLIRDKDGHMTDEDKEAFKKELGDVLWYISQISTELNFTLEDVAKSNLEKLFSRLKRGKISGSGDNR